MKPNRLNKLKVKFNDGIEKNQTLLTQDTDALKSSPLLFGLLWFMMLFQSFVRRPVGSRFSLSAELQNHRRLLYVRVCFKPFVKLLSSSAAPTSRSVWDDTGP